MRFFTAINPVLLRPILLRLALIIATGLVLSACAETQLLVHTAKRINNQQQGETSEGRYKVGAPYQIGDIWYYPHVDYDYDETGIASWYGTKFHGRKTPLALG